MDRGKKYHRNMSFIVKSQYKSMHKINVYIEKDWAFNGILLIKKKEQSINTCNNLIEAQKHYH